MAPKRAPKEPVDVLARKGYYDEMTNTFEEIHEKREIIEKEIRSLLEERDELVKAIAELQSQLDEVNLSNKASVKAHRKTDRVLRQLEAGGAVARAALRKLLLSRMTLEERVAKVREDFRLSCSWPSSPVSSQKMKRTDLKMTRTLTSEEGDGEITIPMRSYVAGSLEQPPVIVFFHGESYVAGDLETHDWICSALAQLSNAMVLSVAYRQPPEVRFPAPVEDAYGALCWVAEGNLGFLPPTLAVSGDASGGGLAMACTLRARKQAAAGQQAPDIRVQVLFYPWVDVRPTSQSMQNCQEDNDLHILMQEDLSFASEVYGPPREATGDDDDDDDDEPKVEDWMKVEEASPLLAGSFQDLPRTFLAYAADDLLAPDCRSLATRLRKEAGSEAVHELELPGPLGPGFAKDPTRAASYAALAAAGAFASGVLSG